MTEKVYFRHDGGVDDLASLLMLLSYEEQGLIELVGVGVVQLIHTWSLLLQQRARLSTVSQRTTTCW